MADIFFANQDTLTLHIRITKKCNADCSYCSSFETNAAGLMSIEDVKKSIQFIKNKIIELKLGGLRKSLTVQYIGGELLTINSDYLLTFSNIVRNELSPLFEIFKHGAQSNLIGSEKKINTLANTFDGNIGTSYDNFTNQRTILGNSEKYKTIFLKNVTKLKKQFAKSISGIVVLDDSMAPFIHEEIKIANSKKTNITIRPVFNGGSLNVNKLSISNINDIYKEIFDNWFLKQNIIIDPFFNYTQKRIHSINQNHQLTEISGCPSQHNCAFVSLNLEPNGSLYVCLDLADSKQLELGNSITGVWNQELFNQIAQRSYHLKNECYSCSYFKECQGGCMKEAIEQENGMYGKTQFCSTWKQTFALIDEQIKIHGTEKIQNWLNKINYY